MKHTLSFLLLNLLLCFGVQGQTYNYAEALQKSLYFYDANKCGVGIDGGKLTWRGNCHISDAVMPLNSEKTNMSDAFISAHIDILDPDGDGTIDVAGGYHDAGDHVQFGLPQSYSSSTLEWAMYEFKDAFVQIGEYDHMMDILHWASDYYLKCTYRDAAGDVIAFCYQVGEGNIDHNLWAPPELVDTEEYPRPAYFATSEEPASDQCAGAAASLALSYLNNLEDDAAYAAECLETAEALYAFAVENRGLGYDGGFYNSSYDEDEMAWAAIWLYIATENEDYLTDITSIDANGMYTGWLSSIINSAQDQWQNIWVHSWDTKWGGVFAKLAPITNEDFHWYIFRWNLEYWSGVEHEEGADGNYLAKTPAGFSYLNSWGSARYNAAAQFQGMVYKKYADDRFDAWMTDQMNYILGDNPLNKSYIVGYSDNHVMHPHHRAAHGSPNNSMFNPPEHKHTLWGALVGGPGSEDEHVDETNDFIYNEVAIDYNAGAVGALAGHVNYFGAGQEPVAPFPPADPELVEYTIQAKMHEENTERSQLSIQVRNESAFPPRKDVSIAAQYYFDISELIEHGQTIDDVSFAVYYDENAVNDEPVEAIGPMPYDEENGIYYMEFQWPEGGFYGTREYQFGLLAGQDSEFNSHWDPTNDYSRNGIGEEYEGTTYIPMYADGELVVGALPGDGPVNRAPSALVAADPESGAPPLTVSFDGSASVDPDGDDITFAWDFGDGNTANTVNATNTYSEAGIYLVSLTVSDGQLDDVATLNISVSDNPDNTAPVAVIQASPQSGTFPLMVSFDASGSTDAENDPLSYIWDFGDGATATGLTANHTYEAAGEFTASLEVNDGVLSDIENVIITVNEPDGEPTCDSPVAISLPFENDGAGEFCWVTSGNIDHINSWGLDILEINGVSMENVWTNQLPARINGNYYIYMVASMGWSHLEIVGTGGSEVTPVAADIQASPLTGTAPLTVSLDASGSTGEGSLSFNWDLGDGTSSTAATLEKTYTAEGDYTIILTVSDETGVSDTDEVIISVDDVSVEQPPVADISATPLSGIAPLEVSFDASGSTDPQGLPISFSWEFGDGNTAVGEQVTHTYSEAGDYTVRLTADNGLLTDIASVSVVVSEDECQNNGVPVALATSTLPTLEAPVTIGFDGSNSTDPDGDVLSFEWLINGEVFSGVSVDYTFTAGGSYTAVLTVTDPCGALSTDQMELEIMDDPDPEFCENPTSISIPFTQDGAGNYCWVTTTEIAYINSWNLNMLTVNGVDFTNTWSNNLPPAENGEWIIEYSSSVAWGHFEAPQAKAGIEHEMTAKAINVFPNPFSSSVIISFASEKINSIEVHDMTGKLIEAYTIENNMKTLELGEDLQSGVYMLKIRTNEGVETSVIRKK